MVSVLTVTTISAQDSTPKADNGDKGKVVRQVVDNWIQIGTEQYKRGFYAAAEKSFLRAKDYEAYLTQAERDTLNKHLQRAHIATLGREGALAEIRTAGELVKQQKFAEAKAHLQAVAASEFLTGDERMMVKQQLETLEKGPEMQEPMMPDRMPAQSELEKIEPRVAVEQPMMQQPVAPLEMKTANEPAPVAQREPVAVAAGESQQEQTGYIGVINRRRNIIQGRVKAVVNDADARANELIDQGQFDKAKEAVDAAERTVYENQQQLGDYLFNQYTGQLNQLSDRITEGRKLQTQQKEDEKRIKAEVAQQEYKETMAVERQKRISDLFQNALNFQKQQRYEEALGQLELLLAIDPQHNNALILKQTLEDTVSFRKQLEIEKEKSRERVGILLKTEESGIPYAEEMTYPKNWREIVAKPTRQPEEAAGQDPANALVEKQLDEIVDLSGLSPEMPLREAIEALRNSVDPPLKIFVNYSDLYNNANIDQTTPINMDPLAGVRLRRALELLLQSVSAGFAQLAYTISDGVITIATEDSLPPNQEVRVYNITDLVSRPADYYVSAGGGAGGTGGGGGRGGGGGGGGGGQGGGGGGQGGGYFTEEFEEDEEELDRDTIREEATERMNNLIYLIQDTVAPDSWLDFGGTATITAYETKKLVILQTPENHREIEQLLRDMRKALGHQVAIEARFLVVGENFLEEIGLDVFGFIDLGDRFGQFDYRLNTFELAEPSPTGISGSWDIGSSTVQFPTGYPQGNPQFISTGSMLGFFGGRFGGILDNLQASFLIRATQAKKNTESLVAPKVTVMSGESATLQVRRTIRYALPPTISISGTGTTGTTGGGTTGIGGGSTFQQNYGEIPTGPTLNITPTITPDRKHVLLNIVAELWDFLGFETSLVETPIPGGVGGQATDVFTYNVSLPQTERSRVKTRVNVPDGGTLLLGGLKRSAGVEKEVGVPILSKIPVIGRVFTSRSKVDDQNVLLILVKPTIILQEETDSEALAAMEAPF